MPIGICLSKLRAMPNCAAIKIFSGVLCSAVQLGAMPNCAAIKIKPLACYNKEWYYFMKCEELFSSYFVYNTFQL